MVLDVSIDTYVLLDVDTDTLVWDVGIDTLAFKDVGIDILVVHDWYLGGARCGA